MAKAKKVVKKRKSQKKPKAERKKVGRKPFDGKEEDVVVQKLEAAYSVDATDEEACLQADISVRALYNYQEKHPEFVQRKQLLKSKLILVGRNNVAQVMQEKNESNKPTARALGTTRWYLERKKKVEFAPSNNEAPEDDGSNSLTEDRKAEIASALYNRKQPDPEPYEVE